MTETPMTPRPDPDGARMIRYRIEVISTRPQSDERDAMLRSLRAQLESAMGKAA